MKKTTRISKSSFRSSLLSGQYCSKESWAQNCEVMAAALEEKARIVNARASALQTRVTVLLRQAYEYRSKRYSEDASIVYEEASSLESEAACLLNMAANLRKLTEYFKYSAEAENEI